MKPKSVSFRIRKEVDKDGWTTILNTKVPSDERWWIPGIKIKDGRPEVLIKKEKIEG